MVYCIWLSSKIRSLDDKFLYFWELVTSVLNPNFEIHQFISMDVWMGEKSNFLEEKSCYYLNVSIITREFRGITLYYK